MMAQHHQGNGHPEADIVYPMLHKTVVRQCQSICVAIDLQYGGGGAEISQERFNACQRVIEEHIDILIAKLLIA